MFCCVIVQGDIDVSSQACWGHSIDRCDRAALRTIVNLTSSLHPNVLLICKVHLNPLRFNRTWHYVNDQPGLRGRRNIVNVNLSPTI
jgi:hypothetical protein